MASQMTKKKPMKMMLRRLLLAISRYTRRILRHRRSPHSGPASQAAVTSAVGDLPDRDGRALLVGQPANRHPRGVRVDPTLGRELFSDCDRNWLEADHDP